MDDNSGKTSDIQDYCYNYDKKIVDQYQQYIDNTTYSILQGINNLENLNIKIKSSDNLGKEVNNALNITTTTSNQWLKFFPKFSITFQNRKKFTVDEAKDFEKMGNIFDKAFKFTANLENLLKDPKFTNGNYEKNEGKNLDNLKNIEMYFNEIYDLANQFLKLVNFLIIF